MDNIYGLWKWYIAGPLLGLMVPVLWIFGNKMFGVSSNFRHFCAAVLPSKSIEYLKYNWRKSTWGFYMIIGIVTGGFIGAHVLSQNYPAVLPAHYYEPLGLIKLFIGGLLIGFGSRYAGGCTSGHGITGLSVFNWPSLLAIISFFIGGLVVSHFL